MHFCEEVIFQKMSNKPPKIAGEMEVQILDKSVDLLKS